MTAEEARALIPPPGPRREMVNARLAKFRNDIKWAAKKGLHSVKLCDVRNTRSAKLTDEEENAVEQQLIADGYTINKEAGTISWQVAEL